MKNLIEEAGRNLQTILLDYTEKDGGNEGWREVEPYSFREKNGVEYFYGFDINKNGIRGFIVDAINDVEITGNAYKPRWEVEF
ncbi:MAG TPA: WYL domain-containing protein [Aequorivita sp.]|nr:WYL domain-containing protein [Aequorivita sp.]